MTWIKCSPRTKLLLLANEYARAAGRCAVNGDVKQGLIYLYQSIALRRARREIR
jgi:hypothetical protein